MDLKAVVVPKELYYHEVAYVRGLEAELAEAKEQIVEGFKKIEAMREQIANLDHAYGKMQARHDGLVAKIEGQKAAIVALTTHNQDQAKQIAALRVAQGVAEIEALRRKAVKW